MPIKFFDGAARFSTDDLLNPGQDGAPVHDGNQHADEIAVFARQHAGVQQQIDGCQDARRHSRDLEHQDVSLVQ